MVINFEVVAMTGYLLFRKDEVVELELPLFVVAGDAHDILAVLRDHIGVLVDESLTHSLSVVDVVTEDNCLEFEAVGLLENSLTFLATSSVRFSSTRLRSKSLVVVDTIFDLISVFV